MNGAVIAITPGGRKLALRIGETSTFTVYLPEALCQADGSAVPYASLRDTVSACFREREALVLIMACGIAVRMLAPLIRNKLSDPAVVVMDEAGQFAVSLLSGHWGGANDLAQTLAEMCGAVPVITTATDVNGLCAIDSFARDAGARPEPFALVKDYNSAMLRGEPVAVFADEAQLVHGAGLTFFPLSCFAETGANFQYRVLLTNHERVHGTRAGDLYLRPSNLFVGIGCRRGTAAKQILAAIHCVLERFNLAPAGVAGLASIDNKRDEAGLLQAADELGVPVSFYSAADITGLGMPYEISSFVQQTMGVGAVCEPTAVLAAGGGRLIVKKQKLEGITVAVAEADYPWWVLGRAARKR